MNRIFYIILVVLSSVSSVFSQELKTSVRTCRLVFPEKPSGSSRFVYLYDGKTNQKVYLSAVNFSNVLKIESGDTSIILAPQPIRDPENIPQAYPKLQLPKEIRNFYIFISPDRKNEVMPLHMTLLNIDGGKFDIGETLWYNFTKHRVSAKLGGSKMTLHPRKSTISKKPSPNSGYYDAQFIYQRNGAGDYQKITEQRWWFDANSRYVGFVAERGGRLPRIYFFRDFRSKIKESTE